MQVYKILATFLDTAHGEYGDSQQGIYLDENKAKEVAAKLEKEFKLKYPTEFVKIHIQPIEIIE